MLTREGMNSIHPKGSIALHLFFLSFFDLTSPDIYNKYMFVKHSLIKLMLWPKSLIQRLLSSHVQQSFIHNNVPFFAQWESTKLIPKITSGKISAREDPLWQASGADTKEEYELWSWNTCGMACLKMILAYKLKKTVPLVTLGKKCMEYGGYKLSDKKNTIDGLFYFPFVQFIKDEYGLVGRVKEYLTINDIVSELSKKNFVIASVSTEISNSTVRPKKYGGHLVLLLGFDLLNQQFIFHNPDGGTKAQREYVHIKIADFKKFFANKGVVIV